MNCPNCGAAAAEGAADWASCGVIFAKWRERAARPAPAREPPAAPDDSVPSPRSAVLVPAAAFAAGAACASAELPRFLVQAGLAMQVHELGHACAAWLSGRIAIPIPMLTVLPSKDLSVPFALAVTAVLAWGAFAAWREDCRALAAACAALLVVQARATWFASAAAADVWIASAGLGGECAISALLVLAYFHPMPRALRWPAYRTVFLFVGALVLAASLRRWHDASSDFMKVPWGSFWGGDGDVEAMLDGGWTVNDLVKAYSRLAGFCALACALRWGAALWSARALFARPSELLDFGS